MVKSMVSFHEKRCAHKMTSIGSFFFQKWRYRHIRIVQCNFTTHTSSRGSDFIDQDPKGSLLFLSPTSWPEPDATAAGTRTMSLLHHFSSSNLFSTVHFGCGANIPRSLSERFGKQMLSLKNIDSICTSSDRNSPPNIHWHHIKSNEGSEMTSFLRDIELRHGAIQAVVFDRFYAEEAFSFKIREECPNALRILDMQDVHSLRLGRQSLVEVFDREIDQLTDNGKLNMTSQIMEEVMKFNPHSNHKYLHSLKENEGMEVKQLKSYDTFLREMASIHRSDLVFVCSSAESQLLQTLDVPHWKLVPASFFCLDIDCDDEEKSLSSSPNECIRTTLNKNKSFYERNDFVIVGGFKHPPNVDSVKLLRHTIWPRIRKQLPTAQLHVYGAYAKKDILSLDDKKCGFIIHGHTSDLDNELMKRRVMLAPLRYGAGVKGKIIDAWRCGCPVVTTPVGAEGMTDISVIDSTWDGAVVSDTDAFVDAAVRLYSHSNSWIKAQKIGKDLLMTLFNGKNNLPIVQSAVAEAMIELNQRRQSDLIGNMLWHQTMRSTKYFSQWIQLKEKLKQYESHMIF